jgi:hypothetical protein
MRIMSYIGANNKSPVSLVKHKSETINVTREMIADLRCDGMSLSEKQNSGSADRRSEQDPFAQEQKWSCTSPEYESSQSY